MRDSNTIRRSVIKSQLTGTTSDAFAGIVVSANRTDPVATADTWCDGNLFENNTITGGHYGITLVGDPVYFQWFSNFIIGNRIINNTIRDFFERGIYIIGTDHSVIEGNVISRPTRTGVNGFYGLYVDQTNASLAIRRNRISNPFGGNTASTADCHGMYFDYARA